MLLLKGTFKIVLPETGEELVETKRYSWWIKEGFEFGPECRWLLKGYYK